MARNMPHWLYFGCYKEPGHYLWDVNMNHYHPAGREYKLAHFDGMLAPQDSGELYVMQISRLGGWGYTALSFWDCTVDTRPQSNSTFFCGNIQADPKGLFTACGVAFPKIWSRFPKLKWHPSLGLETI